jgi:hypothetical protein
MNFKLFFVTTFFLLYFDVVFSQNNLNSKENDLTVVLHESGLNKLINTIGEISGEGVYEIMFIKSSYTWFLKNTKIKLIKDSALFETDVEIKTGFDNYSDHVKGIMGVSYNKKKNEISINLLDAIVHLRASIMGKSFTIKRIQLADYFKQGFVFDGPATASKEMKLALPNGTTKIIDSKIDDVNIFIEENKIRVCGELLFYEKKEPDSKK